MAGELRCWAQTHRYSKTRMRRGSAKTGACQWFIAREEACGPGETDCAQEPGLVPGEEMRLLEMLAGGGAP